jgi:N-[(2S)-2-amino-2-carboxyethyl]-L-glutamate dehydrogenase
VSGPEFAIVRGPTVRALLAGRRGECVDVVRRAYLLHGRASVNPRSTFLRFPDRERDRIIALPAQLGGEFDVSGIKWIASYPDNVKRGMARASAVLILNSSSTGYPFACLESSIISAARTAASATLAAAELSGRRAARRFGIVGTGLIARNVYEFLAEVGWEIDEVALFDADPAEAERFRREVCRADRHRDVIVSADIDSLLRTSDMILFATTSAAPHVADASLFAHKPLVLHLSLRDLAPEILLRGNNVVDDIDHVMSAGTSLHLAEQEIGSRELVTGTLAQLLRGELRLDRDRPTFFSPFGLGVLDLAVGKWIHDLAVAAREAVAIPDFFPTDAR